MAKANKRTHAHKRDEGLMIVLGVILSNSLTLVISLPTAEATLVGWGVAFVVGYFIPPRPEDGFIRWVLERLTLIGCFYLVVFKMPLLLKRFLPVYLADGIPFCVYIAGFILWIRLKGTMQAEQAKR